METRREFLKNAILLSGATGLSAGVPKSIQRALSIDPEVGSTYLDAEHIVILMQENRSFDHCFGALQGVRGYNDPRVITQPNGNKVWLQTDQAGNTYVPFRFDIKDTKATWMGSIPHSRGSQVDAFNNGRYDNWLEAKRSGHKSYQNMPLTLGHYNREDLPFNYSMADAFTICDNNFCSVMSSTWPNRLFFFAGNVRDNLSGNGRAILNNTIPWGSAHWKTFAEHLEDNDISWKFYQNALSTGGGLEGVERAWLSNFGLNTLEFFSQYNTRFYPRYVNSVKKRIADLQGEIAGLEKQLNATANNDDYYKKRREIDKKKEVLESSQNELGEWSAENYEKLSGYQKNLYRKAFASNDGDPDYMKLTTLKYKDNGEEREIQIPKGDPLYQFREDVHTGKLPSVSWLAAPQNFSDHPSAPWFGAWYVSEILDILTKNPEVWKKTIFILTYDENDGYFDHIPAYIPPYPDEPETGKCSAGMENTRVEFASRQQEINEGIAKSQARTAPVGLGYRVPMIIASPWSRGGKVSSQLFDHTSTLQFLEHFLNKKFNKKIKQDNISNWRRTICGDLTSVFDRFDPNKKNEVAFLNMNSFVAEIYNAKFKDAPTGFKPLSKTETEQVNKSPVASPLMDHQEKGTRVARPIPCQPYVDGNLSEDKKNFVLEMKSGNDVFGKRSIGAPFKVYAPGLYRAEKITYKSRDYKTPNTIDRKPGYSETAQSRDYAVSAGDSLSDAWALNRFEKNQYHLTVYSSNGFFREFKGEQNNPGIKIKAGYERSGLIRSVLTGNILLELTNSEKNKSLDVVITDPSYKKEEIKKNIPAGETITLVLDLKKFSGWYDFTVQVNGYKNFSSRYAGHVETGTESITDPLMGGAVT